MAYTAEESYANEGTGADVGVLGGETGTEGQDSGNAFVAADMGEVDGCYGVAVRSGGCAGGGVEVW